MFMEQVAAEKRETTTVNNNPSQQTTKVTKEVVNPEQPGSFQKKKAIFKTYQVIYYILGIVEVLLAFRIVLKILAANPGNSIVSFIYSFSDPLALPFATIFGVTITKNTVVEWSTIVAMIIYAVVVVGIIKLLLLFKPSSPNEVHKTIDPE
jgi:uncharacterized protein YggT (Ycf19 family)